MTIDCESAAQSVPAWAPTGSLFEGRFYHAAARLPGGGVMVACGGNATITGSLGSAERFDSTSGTWSSLPPLNHTTNYVTATRLLDGRILVVGEAPTAELFDPVTSTWTNTGPLPSAYYIHGATLLHDGRVLVFGGVSGGVDHVQAALFDPATGSWTPTGNMIQGRQIGGNTAVVTLANGSVFVAGGSRGSNGGYASLATCEIWNPLTGTWSAAETMSVARSVGAVTLLLDGRVLITGGGSGGYDTSASAELFDPVTGTLELTGSMVDARAYHSSTLLSDGRVLIAGGWTGAVEPTTACEIYDPVTGTFSSVPDLATPRHSHAAVLLDDGRVLVIGGRGPGIDSHAVASCEIFSPGAPADPDSDLDGLTDAAEINVHGTDPWNADTDGDGLFDGTEVDMAQGGGTPSPLNPDSDADGLLDGAEVLLGTMPGNPDSDGDGVRDGMDPTPLVGGVPASWIESALRTASASMAAVDVALIAAPNSNAAAGRRNAMSSKLAGAAALVASGSEQAAITELASLLAKLDGQPSPPDWMASSPEKVSFHATIQLMIALLAY